MADLYRRRMSVRRLSVLAEQLPIESRIAQSEAGAAAGWGMTDLLLADVFQALTGQMHPAHPRAQTRQDEPRRMFEALVAQRQRIQMEGR